MSTSPVLGPLPAAPPRALGIASRQHELQHRRVAVVAVAAAAVPTVRNNTGLEKKRKPQKPKACKVAGCTTNAHARGVCCKHDVKMPCKQEGCRTGALARGLCTKHGAYGICKKEGCTTAVIAQGLCKKHGANGMCTFPGCSTAARARGFCSRHGGRQVCTAKRCSNAVVKLGLCKRHGTRVRRMLISATQSNSYCQLNISIVVKLNRGFCCYLQPGYASGFILYIVSCDRTCLPPPPRFFNQSKYHNPNVYKHVELCSLFQAPTENVKNQDVLQTRRTEGCAANIVAVVYVRWTSATQLFA